MDKLKTSKNITTFLIVLKKIVAVMCWGNSISILYNLIDNFGRGKDIIGYIPSGIFGAILFSYWGFALWKEPKKNVAINGWLMALLYIAVFIGEFILSLVCGLIVGMLLSICTNCNPTEFVQWVSFTTMTICLFYFPPSKVLPKKFFVNNEEPTNTDSTIDINIQTLQKSEQTEEGKKPLLKEFEESDHSRYMPNQNN